jgi:hypothetical protein
MAGVGHYDHLMRIAFKEWAVVVDQLGRGEQILILRKGGISEGRGGFQLEHPEFLLYPTLFHQQRESVTDAARARFDELLPLLPSGEVVRLEYFAKVVEARRLTCLSDAESLRGEHCWRDDVIAARFEWGTARNIFAMALRVYRLPLPVELPILPAYGGCTSWIELAKEVPTTGAQPVLDQVAFDQKRVRFLSALNPVTAQDPASDRM